MGSRPIRADSRLLHMAGPIYPYGARVRLAAARKSDRRDASYNEDASLARTARRSGAPLFHYSGTKLGANRADPQVEHSFLPTADRSASKSSRPAFDDFIDPVARAYRCDRVFRRKWLSR